MNRSVALHVAYPEGAPDIAVNVSGFHLWFGEAHILKGIDAVCPANRITCVVGPSGSGKTSLVRSVNRMNDDVAGVVFEGAIFVNGRNVMAASEAVEALRTEVGMVFQKPCVFPKSIADNVLFGVQHVRRLSKFDRLDLVEENLRAVALWTEVQHRLNDRAHSLSMGQQQRLCLARTLAVKPRVIMLDEPTSSLDPVSARAIEDLMLDLKPSYTILLVTHNISQARRVADHLVFMCNGQVIEQGPKEDLFNRPKEKQTRDYLNEEYCACD